jgi:hypothetical protein
LSIDKALGYKCRVVQLVAHQILDLGVLGSSPSAAAFRPFCQCVTTRAKQRFPL